MFWHSKVGRWERTTGTYRYIRSESSSGDTLLARGGTDIVGIYISKVRLVGPRLEGSKYNLPTRRATDPLPPNLARAKEYFVEGRLAVVYCKA